MQFSITKPVLKEMVSGLSKIRYRGAYCLPVLEHAHFTAEDGGRLSAMVTNLDDEIIYSADNAQVAGPVDVLVPMAELKTLAKIKGLTEVTFGLNASTSTNDVFELSVTAKINGDYVTRTIETIPTAEFPGSASAGVKTKAYNIAKLIELYQLAEPTASTDKTRWVLNGVYLDNQDKALVATDGKRCGVFNLAKMPFNVPAVLPITRVLKSALLCGGAGRIGYKGDQGREIYSAVFETPTWRYSVRCVEGVFPNYRQVIAEREDRPAITFDTASAEALQTAVDMFCGKDPYSELIICADKVRVLALAKTEESYTHIVLPRTTSTAAVTVNIDGKYLLAALAAGFNVAYPEPAGFRPMRFEGKTSGVYMLMPLDPNRCNPEAVAEYVRQNA